MQLGATKLRSVVCSLCVVSCLLIAGGATAEAADTSTGSGIVIDKGEILTNFHVVESCTKISARFPSGIFGTAILVAQDEKNDLAAIRVISANVPAGRIATFREGSPTRAGESVVALGYPLSGLLASTANLTVGNVSALAGLHDDSRYLQISAPVQPGNSGGPLLDASGHVVGIVTAKLNWRVAKFTGDIPQNVNFAIKAEVVRAFLDSKSIAYQKAASDQQLSPVEVGDIARPFTVRIECEQVASQSAVGDRLKPLPNPKAVHVAPKPWPAGEDPLPPNPVSSLPRSTLTIDTRKGVQRFTVDLALTEEQWTLGIRHSIPTKAGMLYIYHPHPRSVAHSMKDTPVSLDVLFIDSRGRIAGIIERRPPSQRCKSWPCLN
jgi:uncharacterized membrane protein (UPF0127 family)